MTPPQCNSSPKPLIIHESAEVFDVEYSRLNINDRQSHSCTSKKYATLRIGDEEDVIGWSNSYGEQKTRLDEYGGEHGNEEWDDNDDEEDDNKSDITDYFDGEYEPGSRPPATQKNDKTQLHPGRAQARTSTKSTSKHSHSNESRYTTSNKHAYSTTSQSQWQIISTPRGPLLKIGATCTIKEATVSKSNTHAQLIETRRADLSIQPFHGRISRDGKLDTITALLVKTAASNCQSLAQMEHGVEVSRIEW